MHKPSNDTPSQFNDYSAPSRSEAAYKLAEAIGEVDDQYVEEAYRAHGPVAETPEQHAAFASMDINAHPAAAGPQAQPGSVSPGFAGGGAVPQVKQKMPVWKKVVWGLVALVAIWFVWQLVTSIFLFSFGGATLTSMDSGTTSSSTSGKANGWSASSMIGDAATDEAAGGRSDGYSALSSSESSRMLAESVDSGSDKATGKATQSANLDDADAFVLTAGTWNDNENWPFFTNLINGNKVRFPSYGLDPVRRVKVNVKTTGGQPARNEVVELKEGDKVLWTAKTNKEGSAYMFYGAADHPNKAVCNGSEVDVEISGGQDERGQGTTSVASEDETTITLNGAPKSVKGVQVAFIMDTTSSMSDELAYIQKDFASIAEELGGNDILYSANFYRDKGDKYVVKTNDFTNDVAAVTNAINSESASGGGDMPEAVDAILQEVLVNNPGWNDEYAHVAFLIFDAPPHDGTDAAINEAIRTAAAKGIKLVPVVSSNAERDTELFGRACAIETGAPYVFLTDDSGVGESHLEPIIGDYTVEKLHDVIVRIIRDEL